MTITELIEKLNIVKNIFGDLVMVEPVICEDNSTISAETFVQETNLNLNESQITVFKTCSFERNKLDYPEKVCMIGDIILNGDEKEKVFCLFNGNRVKYYNDNN